MESKSPFIVQVASSAKKTVSFFSIPDNKLHNLEMEYFWGFSYCGSFSGYLIFAGPNNLLLMNPFTRGKKIISTSDLKIKSDYKTYRVLLAFEKGSKQEVIGVYSTKCLYVYQTHKPGWVAYKSWGFLKNFVDVVVFRYAIYALT
jgi:hypothetical protein